MRDDLPRALVDFSTGVYTVSEVCRILPGMTPRKVHYWLVTDLLSAPVRKGSRGRATLLSFRQVLEIRTVQHLRDDLDFSLRRVRRAFGWILERLFEEETLRFAKGVQGELIAKYGSEQTVIPGGQGVLEGTIPELNAQILQTRQDWLARGFLLEGYEWLVTRANVQAGAPTIRDTRIETSVIAHMASDESPVRDIDIERIIYSYPQLRPEAVRDALAFEGVAVAA